MRIKCPWSGFHSCERHHKCAAASCENIEQIYDNNSEGLFSILKSRSAIRVAQSIESKPRNLNQF